RSGRRRICDRELTAQPSTRGANAIEREPEGDADDPGPESFRLAQPSEAPVRPDERLLGRFLGILAVVEHAEGGAEDERRAVRQALLELPLERVVESEGRLQAWGHQRIHRVSHVQDAAEGGSVRLQTNSPRPVIVPDLPALRRSGSPAGLLTRRRI